MDFTLNVTIIALPTNSHVLRHITKVFALSDCKNPDFQSQSLTEGAKGNRAIVRTWYSIIISWETFCVACATSSSSSSSTTICSCVLH